jgi:hypothetical protein
MRADQPVDVTACVYFWEGPKISLEHAGVHNLDGDAAGELQIRRLLVSL